MDGMKLCKKCGCHKPHDDFSKSRSNKDGLQSYCKPCHRLSVRAAVKKNPRAKQANRAKHMEKELAANRAYKEAHRLALSEKGREYRARNAEAVKAAKKASKAARRARLRQCEGRFTRADVEGLWAAQRMKCAVCREHLTDYHVDHVVPLAAGGRNDKTNIQLLCPPCNMAKGAKDPIAFMQSRNYLL